MTRVHRAALLEGGPAILFEQPQDGDRTWDMPVLVNLFGTVERVAKAIGRTPDQLRDVGEMLAFLRQPEPPGGFREALEMIPLARKVLAMKPKTVRTAPCQEVVLEGDAIDLGRLPIQTCWPGEPAPLITWPLVVTRGPAPETERTDGFNLGIYRMQVTGRDTTLMRWLHHRGGAQQFAALEGPGLARRAARGLPGRCGDRRGPRDHDRCGDAGAGYALRIPVRRTVAGEEGGTRRLPDRAAQGAGPGGDRHRRPGHG